MKWCVENNTPIATTFLTNIENCKLSWAFGQPSIIALNQQWCYLLRSNDSQPIIYTWVIGGLIEQSAFIIYEHQHFVLEWSEGCKHRNTIDILIIALSVHELVHTKPTCSKCALNVKRHHLVRRALLLIFMCFSHSVLPWSLIPL